MNRLSRKEPVALGLLMKYWIISEGLGPSYNSYRIRKAWGQVSGMEKYTGHTFFKDGLLYVYLTSSVARQSLKARLKSLNARLNEALQEDEKFIKGYKFSRYVDQIILR